MLLTAMWSFTVLSGTVSAGAMDSEIAAFAIATSIEFILYVFWRVSTAAAGSLSDLLSILTIINLLDWPTGRSDKALAVVL